MHHHQQVSKDKPKDGCGLYFKMSCDRGLLRNISGKSEDPDHEPREDPYLWLVADDPRRFQSDAEILFKKIDLKDSPNQKGKGKAYESDSQVQRCF